MNTAHLSGEQSLDIIKREARMLKKRKGLSQHPALDQAAQRMGFQNFAHARKSLASNSTLSLYITCVYRDRRKDEAGRLIAKISISRPFDDIAPRSIRRACRNLRNFSAVASDHLQNKSLIPSRDAANELLTSVAHEIQFMEVTGLIPCKRGVDFDFHGLPHSDHDSVWQPAGLKSPRRKNAPTLLIDEPYTPAVAGAVEKRQTWASQNNKLLLNPDWAGMYVPGHVTPSIVVDIEHSDLALDVSRALSSANPVVISIEEGAFNTPFLSPEATRRPAFPEDPYRPLKHTPGVQTEYGSPFGRAFRPDGRMSLDNHQLVADGLNQLRAWGGINRARVDSSINYIRDELDDWVQREYPSSEDMPQSVFLNLYYRNFEGVWHREPPSFSAVYETIDRLVNALRSSYPACPAMTALLRQFSLMRRSFKSWESTLAKR